MRQHLIAFCCFILIVILMACASQLPSPPLPATVDATAIQIGILTPTSGELATFGRQLQNGVVLAFEQHNATRPNDSPQLTWQTYDSQCDFDAAQGAVRQAVADGVRYLVGPLCTEAALGAVLAVQEADVLLIVPTSPHPRVTRDAQDNVRPFVFQMVTTPSRQGQGMAEFAGAVLDVQHSAVLNLIDDDYGRAIAAAFVATVETTGGQVMSTAVPPSDVAIALDTIVTSDVELLVLPNPSLMGSVADHLETMGRSDIILLGSDQWSGVNALHSTNFEQYSVEMFSRQLEIATWQQWQTDYQATFAIAPDALAAFGFDGGSVLATAVGQGGDDLAGIVTALKSNEFSLPSGLLTFDTAHQPNRPIIFVKHGPDGQTVNAIIE